MVNGAGRGQRPAPAASGAVAPQAAPEHVDNVSCINQIVPQLFTRLRFDLLSMPTQLLGMLGQPAGELIKRVDRQHFRRGCGIAIVSHGVGGSSPGVGPLVRATSPERLRLNLGGCKRHQERRQR